jgi:hypothetical protein
MPGMHEVRIRRAIGGGTAGVPPVSTCGVPVHSARIFFGADLLLAVGALFQHFVHEFGVRRVLNHLFEV